MPPSTPRRIATPALDALLCGLAAAKARKVGEEPVHVPDILLNPAGYRCRYVRVDDRFDFLLGAIDRLRTFSSGSPPDGGPGEELGPTALADLRSDAAMDRRPGTCLSLIPWLVHFVCDLGCRNVVLLPLGPYGRCRRKGKDGSLFALADHVGVSDEYADPALPELSAASQYRAVVELAALAGVRVGTVQPLVTAALDCPHFASDPALTFWWAADPGEVLYSPVVEEWLRPPIADLLRQTCYRPSIRDVAIPIPDEYAARFVDPPSSATIRAVRRDEGTYFVGKSLYRGRMVDVAIANAVPDVIPDRAGHYAWRDIALLNYWQTRVPSPGMLMGAVETNERSPAAKLMSSVMRTRARRYAESVFWIDMARCLPASVRNAAPVRSGHFHRTEIIYEQVTGGWEIPFARPGTVVGEFLCSVAPRTADRRWFRQGLFAYLGRLAGSDSPTRYLAGPGTHDVIPPEARIAALLVALAYVLPGAQPLIVSGQERFAGGAINAEFGEMTPAGYAEDALTLFSGDPDRSVQGTPAAVLAREHGLPTMAHLVPEARALRRVVRECKGSGPASFATRNIEGCELGCWTAGGAADGRWCSILIRIDDGPSLSLPWEDNWRIVWRPMSPAPSGCPAGHTNGPVTVAPVDLAVVGGPWLASCWRDRRNESEAAGPRLA